MSTTGVGIYSSDAKIRNNLIEHSIFKRANYKLDPVQQELLRWHSRESRVNLDRVRIILARPHQPKGSFDCGEIERRMVVPIISTASIFKQCWYTAIEG